MAKTREYDALIPALERARVPRDGVLIVHSAIALLSRQGYRAENMIEAYLEHLAVGTLIMPTMTWRTVTPQHPYWDELATPSHTGIMSEIFRANYATARSIHPTHSVAAHGPQAQRLLARHHLDDTPVSANSPYGLMRGQAAHVFMLGVGLESCTAIHLPEEEIAPEIYVRPLDPAEIYKCRDRHGVVHRMHARRHYRLNRDFPHFGPPLRAKGLLHGGKIAGCGYLLVRLDDLLGEVRSSLHADKFATLAPAPETT